MSEPVELVVVGGGVNGCAIARDAALRGVSTVLLERHDFGCATSAWCSRLVHGGLKYLQTLEIGLVRESLAERQRLLDTAPHLVRPYRMAVPAYRSGRRSGGMIEAGMVVYDLLSVGKSLPRHRVLGRRRARQMLPGIQPAGLLGAALYYDAQVEWPERLCVELASDARTFGATVLNHAECTAVRRHRSGALQVTYRSNGRSVEQLARRVVNVTGAWVDQTLRGCPGESASERLVRTSKGTHLAVDPFPGAPACGVFFEHPGDGRPMLVLPWAGRYLLGSTDLWADGPPDEVVVEDAEVAYILRAVNCLIPSARLEPADVLAAYVGLRPLPEDGRSDPGAVSRDFRFVEHETEGLVSVVGGKLTTHRLLASRILDRLLPDTRGSTATGTVPLAGARGDGSELLRSAPTRLAAEVARVGGWPGEVGQRLVDVYGTGALQIARRAAREGSESPSDDITGLTTAETAHAVEVEMAGSTTDVLLRRTMRAWRAPAIAVADVERLSASLCQRYGWDYHADRADATSSLQQLGLLGGRAGSLSRHRTGVAPDLLATSATSTS